MRSRLLRLFAVCLAVVLLDTGCMLSRAVDRAFIGISVRRPSFEHRKTTGVFLLPLTFALDAATFPIQALLVVILGDNFPFNDADSTSSIKVTLRDNPQYHQLTAEQQAIAARELDELIRSGQVRRTTSLALMPDGHWALVELDAEARDQLLARAQQPAAQPAELAVCLP